MTKVTIIDVDLDIGKIITEEVTAVTGQTKTILAEFRETQLETAKLKQSIDNAADAAKTKLLAAIQQLVDAGPKGIPVSEIYTLVLPEINTIALTAKIKHQLKSTGNEWVLIKQKIQKVDRYILIPYNQEST